MATLKVVISSYASQDKTRAVKIRLTHNRQSVFIGTDFRLAPHEVTAGGKIKNAGVTNQLDQQIRIMRDKLTSIGMRINKYNIRDLRTLLERTIAIKEGIVKDSLDFIDYSRQVISRIEQDHWSVALTYKTLVKNMDIYTQGNGLDFNDITPQWLRDFEEWLRAQPCRQGKYRGDTSINHFMKSIREIYNRARNEFNDEERGEILIPFYPFNKYKVPAEAEVRSRALEAEEIHAIATYTPTDRWDELARDVFMLSFYLMGMNLPDMWNLERREGYRIIYVRGKVARKRGSDAEISVAIPPEALPLFDKYADPTGGRVFDFYKRYSTVRVMTQRINLYLKKVRPELTLYCARHSFASIACNNCDFSIEDVGRCLNHVIDKRIVTNKYIKRDFSKNDRVQRAVIDFVFKNE